jgi:two-component system cell cycle response regulator
VPRILLVDDSNSARALLSMKLQERGFEVIDVGDAAKAAEMALASPPHCVVTDLRMPGVSGLQLCRLLRSEAATAHVPILLLTASDDRRSRFWAKHAGATAYVTKTEVDRLLEIVGEISNRTAPSTSMVPSLSTRGTVPERLSQLLDAALYESTIAGQVRALGQQAHDVDKVFTELAGIVSDVTDYRWLGLVNDAGHLMFHANPGIRSTAEREVRDALEVPPLPERRSQGDSSVFVLEDTRPTDVEWSAPPLVQSIKFGDAVMGRIAFGPGRRGASHEDRRLIGLVATELGGVLRMASLVAEARRLAATDALTGLMNRRAFVEAMDRERSRSERHMFPLSVLILDVDFFKKVNDTKGHDAGDAVLKGVAAVLKKMARKSDFVARWGGEEFVVALSQTAEAGARVAAERVRRAIAEAPHTLPGGETLKVTASIGLASAASPKWHLEEMLARADKALYAAKARGRNRVELG